MFKRLLLAAGLAAATSTAVSAATSLDVTISDNTNVPVLTLTNTSDTALLERFSISIGLLSRNFDFAMGQISSAGIFTNLVTPDGVNDGVRSDEVIYSFSGFAPTFIMSFETDIDEDSGTQNVVRDYRNTFFNNGAGPNSVMTAEFSDGSILSLEMPDQTPGLSRYSFSLTAAPIPLPAGLPLLAAGLGALAVMRRRKG